MAIDKETLFLQDNFPEEIVEIPGKGEVRIRALTRAEMHSMNPNGKTSAADVEYRTVVFGMLEPSLDIKEVKQWANVASVGEFQVVLRAIMRLSGMSATEEEVNEAQKSAYKSVRE
jgi:hypothetical protein